MSFHLHPLVPSTPFPRWVDKPMILSKPSFGVKFINTCICSTLTNEMKCKYVIKFLQSYFTHEGLTLKMLNCFEDYKRCIHVLYHILDFVQRKKTRFTMEQPYMLPILYCQYHSCWCPGDLRSQGISRNGIDQISQEYSVFNQSINQIQFC